MIFDGLLEKLKKVASLISIYFLSRIFSGRSSHDQDIDNSLVFPQSSRLIAEDDDGLKPIMVRLWFAKASVRKYEISM